jgi:biotin synthase-related radical SAM superfamily protein
VISFSITADENSTGTAAGTISLPRTAKLVRFHPAKVTLTAGKPATLTLRLSKRDARLVRNLLNHHKLKAKVAVTVNDAAGNRTLKKLTLRLKR